MINADVVHQGHLLKCLNTLFENVQSNARKPTGIKYAKTKSYVQLDMVVPENNICFEFQDSYHYVSMWYAHKELQTIRKKDSEKLELVRKQGMDLVVVPCWWDMSVESLVATIQFVRPDLLANRCVLAPIPLNPPLDFFPVGVVPHIGELMLASFPLGEVKISKQVPWWFGEKYDGVRCCWNPITSKLYTRRGTELDLEPALPKLFPPTFLDSEVWFGRGQFVNSWVFVHGSENVPWDSTRMVSFDTPTHEYANKVFKRRYQHLLDSISAEHPFVVVACRVLCTHKIQCEMFVKLILEDKGEGAILRKPNSIYEHRRTANLLKIKGFHGDQEAIITGKNYDSVTLKLPNNVSFDVSATNTLVPIYNLKLGDIVTFSYEHGTRREIPLDPKILRIRYDLIWEDVVHSSKTEKPEENTSFKAKPVKFWDLKNMCTLFEKVAKSLNMDPHNPQTWYILSYKSFAKFKGAQSVFAKIKGGYIYVVTKLFPGLKLDPDKFAPQMGMQYLHSEKKRRIFFEDYAREHKFDPLVAENWYYVTAKQLRHKTKFNSVIAYYAGFKDALMKLFPNIGLDKSKIGIYNAYSPKKGVKRKKKNAAGQLKQFFLDFAKKHNFDPLVADNWYQLSKGKYQTKLFRKVSYIIRGNYQGRVSNALVELFPDIGLEKSHMSTVIPHGYFSSLENQKKFFESVAEDYNFDPANPAHWSQVSKKVLLERKGYRQIRDIYKGIDRALAAVYPTVNWGKLTFRSDFRSR